MKLADLANALELPLHGNSDQQIDHLAPIESALAHQLSFVVSTRYLDALRNSQAGAVIVPESLRADAPGSYLVSANPYASYARASWLLTPDKGNPIGIHSSACVDHTAVVADSARIGAGVVIGANVVIQANADIGAQCFIGDAVRIGRNTRLFARTTILQGCVLGADCRVQSGAVIGAEGFGYAWQDGWQSIHQTGGVNIGNGVHIGANTTIDRGAIDDTIIADGVILDNQIQIAHNVQIGENTAIAGCVGIAGSTRIGRNCQIGGACNIVGHLHITDGVHLSAASLVTQSITTPGRYSSGMPLQTSSAWRRTYVTLGKLDVLLKRIRRLERSS